MTSFTALKSVFTLSNFEEKLIKALRSFGRQLPPKPGPALRNNGPILSSLPIAFAIVSTSTLGRFWHKFAIELMKLIFVARKALLVYLMSSAGVKSVCKI